MKKENKDIRKVLLKLGITSNLYGYQCILTGTELVSKGVTKTTEVYRRVCKILKATSAGAVERNIRNAIEISYKKTDCLKRIYFKKPTPSVLLNDLVYNIDLFLEEIGE